MYFRDARSKFDHTPFTKKTEEPNPYYQEYLNKDDDNFLDGYDWATEEEIVGFFNNLDVFLDDLDNDILFDPEKLDENLLAAEEVTDEDKKAASKETRFMLWLKESLLQYMELSRDELVTSMIDAMEDEEYSENFKKVWGKTPDEYDLERNSADFEEIDGSEEEKE